MSTLPPPPPASMPPMPPQPPAGYAPASQAMGGYGYGYGQPQPPKSVSAFGSLFDFKFGVSQAARWARSAYIVVVVVALGAVVNTIVLGLITSISLFRGGNLLSIASSFSGSGSGMGTGMVLLGVYLLIASIVGAALTAMGMMIVGRATLANYVKLHER